jgi:nicotinamide riboside kinase
MPTLLSIALLGAESTGKSTLAQALHMRLRQADHSVVRVDEVLRRWCDTHGRTPQVHEQPGIAAAQQAAIEHGWHAPRLGPAPSGTTQATQHHTTSTGLHCVVADTTPLQTAVYSEVLFNDPHLLPAALHFQRQQSITLLMGLDLPWTPDGHQRDGPQARAPVDARLRHHLQGAAIPFVVIHGHGAQRVAAAWLAVCAHASSLGVRLDPAHNRYPDRLTASPRWQCETCSDAQCEHRLFTRLKHGLATDDDAGNRY